MRCAALIFTAALSAFLLGSRPALAQGQSPYLATLEVDTLECQVGDIIHGKLSLAWPVGQTIDTDLLRQLEPDWACEVLAQRGGLKAGTQWLETDFRCVAAVHGETQLPSLLLRAARTNANNDLVLARTQAISLRVNSRLDSVEPKILEVLEVLEAPGRLKDDPFVVLRWTAVLVVVTASFLGLWFWRRIGASSRKGHESVRSSEWYRDQLSVLTAALKVEIDKGDDASATHNEKLQELAIEAQAVFVSAIHLQAKFAAEKQVSARQALSILATRMTSAGLAWDESRLVPTLRDLEALRYRHSKLNAQELVELVARIDRDLEWLDASLKEMKGSA